MIIKSFETNKIEIDNMIKTVQSNEIPASNKKCKNCAYARQRSKIDKL